VGECLGSFKEFFGVFEKGKKRRELDGKFALELLRGVKLPLF